MSTGELKRRIAQGLGREPADLVIQGGRWLNVITGELVRGDIAICGDRIVGTYDDYRGAREIDARDLVAVPGFIDGHVHCESTLVTPDEFDRCVLPHGTTTAICDPHEIANVIGEAGIRYFQECAETLALDLRVQLSSCVPATHLETAGATLDAAALVRLRGHRKGLGLAEFMNVPGVLAGDPGVLEKLSAFADGPIDGHAPLVRGRDLNAYLSCGIRNCHESTGLEEAREKLRKGMQVLVREGSVSKDVRALAPLFEPFASPFLALCTDDRNPLDIAHEGHLDFAIRKAISLGAPAACVYRAASWSAAQGFGLRDRGLIAPGWRADLVLLGDLERCTVARVVKDGRPVDDSTFAGRRRVEPPGRDSVRLRAVSTADFAVPGTTGSSPVIGVIPDRLLTDFQTAELPCRDGLRQADPARDLLKICVLERHGRRGSIGRGFVRGFGLREGALASTVGHDSHNVAVVGVDDASMALAVNHLRGIQGGFVAVRGGRVVADVALPIAGLMSDRRFEEVEGALRRLRESVRDLGCPLNEPLLQLAFLPLAVIPHLKITDLGLVDVDKFALIEG